MALVLCLMTILTVVGFVGALLPLTVMEPAIAAHHRRAAQAFYAAQAALHWTVDEMRAERSWNRVLRGTRRSLFRVGSTRQRLADGRLWDLQHEAEELERGGAGPHGVGRGLRWQVLAYGPLGDLMPHDPTGGLLVVGVWVADDASDGDHDPLRDSNGSVAIHAAAAGPAAYRALQATLTRTPAGHVAVTSWVLAR